MEISDFYKKERRTYRLMINLTEEEHNLLRAFARLEKRPKTNAATLLLTNTLKAIFSKTN